MSTHRLRPCSPALVAGDSAGGGAGDGTRGGSTQP